MPQTNVLPDWKATYVHDAPCQKPGGITVSTALIANAVPNKPTYTAGTIQMTEAEATEAGIPAVSEVEDEQQVEDPVEEADPEPEPHHHKGRSRHR